MSTQDKLAEALVFLDRVHRGLISGRISEWPGLREACGVVYAAYVSDVAYDGNTVARKNVQLIDEALAAHDAQAQPPAASVMDAMVNAAMLAYNVECHSQGDATNARADGMRAALGAALAAQENPNG